MNEACPVMLRLEHIGECYDRNRRHYERLLGGLRIGAHQWKQEFDRLQVKSRRPWVAIIKGLHPDYGLEREFVDSIKDYAHANSVGSRGIYFCFHLYPGEIYEVRHFTSWKHEDRYFCHVWGGRLIRLPNKEVYSHFVELHRMNNR